MTPTKAPGTEDVKEDGQAQKGPGWNRRMLKETMNVAAQLMGSLFSNSEGIQAFLRAIQRKGSVVELSGPGMVVAATIAALKINRSTTAKYADIKPVGVHPGAIFDIHADTLRINVVSAIQDLLKSRKISIDGNVTSEDVVVLEPAAEKVWDNMSTILGTSLDQAPSVGATPQLVLNVYNSATIRFFIYSGTPRDGKSFTNTAYAYRDARSVWFTPGPPSVVEGTTDRPELFVGKRIGGLTPQSKSSRSRDARPDLHITEADEAVMQGSASAKQVAIGAAFESQCITHALSDLMRDHIDVHDARKAVVVTVTNAGTKRTTNVAEIDDLSEFPRYDPFAPLPGNDSMSRAAFLETLGW